MAADFNITVFSRLQSAVINEGQPSAGQTGGSFEDNAGQNGRESTFRRRVDLRDRNDGFTPLGFRKERIFAELWIIDKNRFAGRNFVQLGHSGGRRAPPARQGKAQKERRPNCQGKTPDFAYF